MPGLLDNMSSDTLRQAVAMVDGRAVTKAADRITPATAPRDRRERRRSDLDRLAHRSSTTLDIGLDHPG
jgi:nicotinate-nucleotide pyrophosphorylase (carboxylating)